MTEVALPKLEFRVPISPNEQYMRMLHYFLESLQAFGGPVANAAHTVVSVSAEGEPFDLKTAYPWTRNYSVDFRWVDQALFDRDSYEATGYDRLWVESDADMVVLADADLLFAGDFDDIILRSSREQRLLGFIAHVSPFDQGPGLVQAHSEWLWDRIFDEAGLPRRSYQWEHTGWSLMSHNPLHRYSPAYFNYGFIVAPRRYVEQMGETFLYELVAVDKVFETWFKSQIANTLCFARHEIPVGTLPLKYNFPLHVDGERIRALNPDPEGEDAVDDIKVFHYLGYGEVNKDHFATAETLAEVLNRESMSPEGKFFQQRLRTVHRRICRQDADALRSVGTAPDSQPLAASSQPDLFMVLGGRRSGTTLLAAILSSDERANPLGQEAQILTRLLESYRWGRNHFDQFGVSFFQDQQTYRRFFLEIGERFAREVAGRISPGNVLVLKNPEFSLVATEITELFPEAMLLAMVRDPRDQIASELEVAMRRLSDAGQDPLLVNRNVVQLAKNYVNYYRPLHLLGQRQPGRIYFVRYEDLVLRPEEMLDKLRSLTGLNIAFDPGSSWPRLSELAGLDTTPSRSALYGEPVSESPAGRFRRDLRSEEIHQVENQCAELMAAFGYPQLAETTQ